MGQLNAHPLNGPAAVCPAGSPRRRRRACWRPALNAIRNLENQASSGRSSPFPSCRRSGRINNDCRAGATPRDGAPKKRGDRSIPYRNSNHRKAIYGFPAHWRADLPYRLRTMIHRHDLDLAGRKGLDRMIGAMTAPIASASISNAAPALVANMLPPSARERFWVASHVNTT
jgi:hypothetical protein